ncbi:MAG: 1-acyl-sn-glycerol-3-phosphate acyltransferase [Clostridiales bacterium]|nr:1-acyl-sn-glycerol-3-phosphate acyltransferase [Clostridiales bacterium]
MKRHKYHVFMFYLLKALASPVVKAITGYSCVKEKGPPGPAIIIANHNTDLDPVLVALGFSRHIYFLASEHAFRKNLLVRLIFRLCAVISINKTHSDSTAVKEMLRRLKAGYNVCLFAEGNRSYTGVTGYISPATAKLVKASGAQLITFRLEGGYLTTPRWAKGRRKGKMAGCVAGRYSAADLRAMTNEDVLSVIKRDIYENAYERQKDTPIPYRGKDLAEHIETVLYLCPSCQSIGTIHSRGDDFFCGCGLKATYTETGFLEGRGLPFSTIAAWNSWQVKRLADIVRDAGEEPICGDEAQRLFKVQPTRSGDFMGEGELRMTAREFSCAGFVFPLEQITRLTIVDQMTLVFSLKDGTHYEIRSVSPRNALKYTEIMRILKEIHNA